MFICALDLMFVLSGILGTKNIKLCFSVLKAYKDNSFVCGLYLIWLTVFGLIVQRISCLVEVCSWYQF